MNEMRAVMFTISNGNVENCTMICELAQKYRFVSRFQLIWVNTVADAKCYKLPIYRGNAGRFWSDHEPEQKIDGVVQ